MAEENLYDKNCGKVRDNLIPYIVTALTDEDKHFCDCHLEKCPACSKSYNNFNFVWQELGEVSVTMPTQLEQKLGNYLGDLLSPPSFVAPVKSFWRPAAVWAAVILGIVISWYWYDDGIPVEAARLHLKTVIPKEIPDKLVLRNLLRDLLKFQVDIPLPSATTLLGGNVSRLNQMVVAQVMYQYQGIPISLFIWDGRWPDAYTGISRNAGHPVMFRKYGQHVIIWENQQILYCLVAKLDNIELASIFGLPTGTRQSP